MNKTNLVFPILIAFLLVISCNNQDEFEYPLVFTGNVINITDTSATFTARISNFGKFTIIESGFIWGIHSQDNNGIKVKNEGEPDKIYSLQTNKKFEPGWTYFVRAYVQTEFAITYGKEVSFTIPENGQTKPGSFTKIADHSLLYGNCELIKCSFTVSNKTYFIFEYGLLYSYNPLNNTFNSVPTSTEIQNASYSVVYNGTAYIFSANALYTFDPVNKTFKQLNVLSENIYGAVGFLIDDNIYIGLGGNIDYSKKFWKYSISNNNWQQVASFPGNYRAYAFSFSLKHNGYVGGGYNLIDGQWPYPKFNDLWCYIQETDQWIQKEYFPVKNEELMDLRGANTDEFGYCYYKNELFEYNPDFDFWAKVANLDIGEQLCYPYVFEEEGKVYITEARGYMDENYFKLWQYEK